VVGGAPGGTLAAVDGALVGGAVVDVDEGGDCVDVTGGS